MVLGYYINLKNSKIRNDYMIKQIKKQKLNIKRFEGVNLTINTEVKLNDLCKKKILTDKKYIIEKQKIGSVACLLAHTSLWKHLKKNKKEKYFLILEDDCKLCSNFNNELKMAIKSAPKNWDMIWLGYNNIKGKKISEYYFQPDVGFNKNYNTQHHCYVINVKSIDKILNILFPIPKKFTNKDSILRENFHKFNAYFYFKKLGVQDITTFPDSIRTNSKNG